MDKDTLRLPITGKWYDMILSGVKKEEYRDIKPYYKSRLQNLDGTFKQFKYVEFVNGYGHRCPRAKFECLGITEGLGNIDWGAPFVFCYIISIGNLIEEIKPWLQ